MNEGASLAVGRQLAGCRILEAFDNSRLARAVVTDNQGQWGVELNGLAACRAKGPDAGDGELFDPRHV